MCSWEMGGGVALSSTSSETIAVRFLPSDLATGRNHLLGPDFVFELTCGTQMSQFLAVDIGTWGEQRNWLGYLFPPLLSASFNLPIRHNLDVTSPPVAHSVLSVRCMMLEVWPWCSGWSARVNRIFWLYTRLLKTMKEVRGCSCTAGLSQQLEQRDGCGEGYTVYVCGGWAALQQLIQMSSVTCVREKFNFLWIHSSHARNICTMTDPTAQEEIRRNLTKKKKKIYVSSLWKTFLTFNSHHYISSPGLSSHLLLLIKFYNWHFLTVTSN